MKSNRVVFIAFILVACSFVYAGSIIKEFTFPAKSIKISNQDGFSLVSLKGCDLSLQETGKPILPFLNLNVLIPSTAEITSIEVLEAKQTEIPGEYLIYPAQPPVPTSFNGELSFTSPDQATYQSATEYPGNLYKIIPSGNKSEFRIGGVFLYPLQYIPNQRKLVLSEKIRIRINYEEGKYQTQPLTQSQKDLFQSEVRSLVINPEDAERFSPQVRVSDNPDIDYVILTDTTLIARFAPMVNWLKKTGFLTATRTTRWVIDNYTGRDVQEKIRNFVRDYYNVHGLKYILFAGDTGIVPVRQARANCAGEVGDIPCDLYYLDLQWSWDGNHNNIFGEVAGDTTDLYYDLYGGRWPVSSVAEVDTMIRKFMTYVRNPDTLYQKRMLLPYGVLWSGYSGKASQDSIANTTPTGWTDRYINTQIVNEVRDSLNNGFGFCHLCGHGNEAGVYYTSSGPDMYTTTYSHPQSQTNYNKLSIVNSNACYPGNFEYSDCLAEEMMKARGSAIAVIMNSRYGWGYSSGPIGASELIDVRFYNYLFTKDSIRIANCHQASKQFYRSSAVGDECWLWCYYETNLFGEPAMMIWTDNPKKMASTFSHTIATGSQTFNVDVTSSGSALQSALVTLWKGSEVYLKALTNSSGRAIFTSINPTSSGYMYVTITAKNKIPNSDSSLVSNSTNDVGIEAIYNPGSSMPENTALTPRALVKNYGTATQTNFSVVCSIVGSAFRYVNTQTVTSLASSDTIRVNFSSWTPTIAEMCTVKIRTNLAGDANLGNDRMTRTTEVMLLNNVGVDSIIYPLESHAANTAMIPIARIKNYGYSNQTSFPVVCSIVGGSGVVRYTNTQTISLNAGDTNRVSFASWTPTIAELCTVKMRTSLSGDEYSANNRKTRTASIIQMYSENFDASNGSFSANPTSNGWEWGVPTAGPSSAHSGTKLWATVLGDSYANNADWKLTSKEFIATANNPTLKFWHWYNIELSSYYTGRAYDGGNVKISTDSGVNWSVIRPIGGYDGVGYTSTSGIAGESCYSGIATFWQQEEFSLPINTNQRFFLRWHFGSDASVRRLGWYVDDVTGTGFTPYSSSGVVDVGVNGIIRPTGTYQVNNPIQPIARVKNYGNVTQTNIPVVCSIVGSAFRYTNTQIISSLAAGDTARVNFSSWTPAVIESCTVKMRTNLTADQNSANDRLTNRFYVADLTPPAVPSLISPVSGSATENQTPDFIWHSISEATVYNIVITTAKLEVINENVSDTTFTPDRLASGIYSWSVRASDEYSNWSNFSSSWTLTIIALTPGWTQKGYFLTRIPGKNVKDGGSIVAVTTEKNSSVLYAFRGNKSNEFYRYDGAWTSVETMPYGCKPGVSPPAINKKKVGDGASLCFDGINTIYATKGNNTREFWAYDINSSSWTAEAYVSVPKAVKGGTSIAYYDGKVYLLAGSQKATEQNFFAYDVTTNIWSTLTRAPSPDYKAYKDGSCIIALGGKIYALKGSGSGNYFARYDNPGWTQIQPMPLQHHHIRRDKKVKDGSAMATDGSIIYAVKGGTNEFWQYEPDGNVWTPLDTVRRLNNKSIAKTGASLTYDGMRVYLLKGNNTLEFWQFIPYKEISNIQILNSTEQTLQEFNTTSFQPINKVEVVPNPINRNSVIEFNLARAAIVKISLYNSLGQIQNMIVSQYYTAGSYALPISARELTAGIYHLQIDIGNKIQTIKLIVK